MFKFKKKRGFKVCSINNEKYESAFYFGTVVIYKKNKWTKKPEIGGPLAVFNLIEDVIEFINHNISLTPHIFKCKYKESKDTELWRPKRGYEVDEKHILYRPPKGTIFADKVKILREIYDV